MSQVTSGVRSILSIPYIYRAVQYVMGARSLWNNLAKNYLTLQPGMRVLDIGCGPGDILEYLPASTEYWGYDISEEYIANAKQRYGARGHFVCKFLVESDLQELPKFDRVLLTGVFHHLDDDVANQLIALAYASLNSGGQIVSVDPCYTKNQNQLARFLISKDRGQNVRTQSEYLALVKSKFFDTKSTVVHRAWIPYTHCYMVGIK